MCSQAAALMAFQAQPASAVMPTALVVAGDANAVPAGLML